MAETVATIQIGHLTAVWSGVLGAAQCNPLAPSGLAPHGGWWPPTLPGHSKAVLRAWVGRAHFSHQPLYPLYIVRPICVMVPLGSLRYGTDALHHSAEPESLGSPAVHRAQSVSGTETIRLLVRPVTHSVVLVNRKTSTCPLTLNYCTEQGRSTDEVRRWDRGCSLSMAAVEGRSEQITLLSTETTDCKPSPITSYSAFQVSAQIFVVLK